MKKVYINKRYLLMSGLALLMFAFGGCTEENLDDCPWFPTRIKVVVSNTTEGQTPANPSDVKGVKLYVFDQDEFLVGIQDSEINQVSELNYPDAGSDLQVFAIANCSDRENEIITCSEDYNQISQGGVQLIRKGNFNHPNASVGQVSIFKSPSDLFHGVTEENINNGPSRLDEVNEVGIQRIVGSVKVTVRKLKENNTTDDDDFSLVLVTNHQSVNLYAEPQGEKAAYAPECMFVKGGSFGDDIFLAPTFKILSSELGESAELHILRNGEVIDTVKTYYDTDKGGEVPLTVQNGKHVDILVDYRGGLSVMVDVNEWGQETVWKDYF